MTTQPMHSAGAHTHTHDFVQRLNASFSALSSAEFARKHALSVVLDPSGVLAIAANLSDEETWRAAEFLPRLGEQKMDLPPAASDEQRALWEDSETDRKRVLAAATDYERLFGIRFITYMGNNKTTWDVLEEIRVRRSNPKHIEYDSTRSALGLIAVDRLKHSDAYAGSVDILPAAARAHTIPSYQVCITTPAGDQNFTHGANLHHKSRFGIGALSHVIATAFAFEYFAAKRVSLDSPVNKLLKQFKSPFALRAAADADPRWADRVVVRHLLRHTAGLTAIPLPSVQVSRPGDQVPVLDFLSGRPHPSEAARWSVEPIFVEAIPGNEFRFSYAGFLVLQHLIEVMEGGRPVAEVVAPFLRSLGIADECSFSTAPQTGVELAAPRDDSTARLTVHLHYPALAAGGVATAGALQKFNAALVTAYDRVDGCGPISHDTARRMLHHSGHRRGACQRTLGCNMGTGVFLIPGEENDFFAYTSAVPGFRALTLFCNFGPDSGKGFTILCAAETNGVKFVAEVARRLLEQLDIHGFDGAAAALHKDVPVEPRDPQLRPYFPRIARAFAPESPEAIPRARGEPKDLQHMHSLLDGAIVAFCTNDRFGRIENVISRFEPKFDPLWFGRQGFVVDAWETSRHNNKEADFAIFNLKEPGEARYVYVSTKWYDEDFIPQFVQVQGSSDPNERDDWFDLLPKTRLQPHSILRVKLDAPRHVRRLKLINIPDGGITRVAVYTKLNPDFAPLYKPLDEATPTKCQQEIPKPVHPNVNRYGADADTIKRNAQAATAKSNAASAAFGASIVAMSQASDVGEQVISPLPPLHNFDGYLTRRSRHRNNTESIDVALAWRVRVECIVVDFTYFRNNAPISLSVSGKLASESTWKPLVPWQYVKHYGGGTARFVLDRAATKVCDHVRISFAPCGGFHRVKVFGPKEGAAPASKL